MAAAGCRQLPSGTPAPGHGQCGHRDLAHYALVISSLAFAIATVISGIMMITMVL